jgi:hypothetical protein
VSEVETPLVGALRTCWPGAELVPRQTSAELTWAYLPDREHARMLVPVHGPAAARSVRRASSATGSLEGATRTLASAAIRLSGGRILRDRVGVVAGQGVSLLDHLAGVLGEPVGFALAVGSERVNRKPVLQVLDRRSRCVAFAKLGDSAQARLDVAGEATHLRALGGLSWQHLAVPRLLDFSAWGEVPVLLVSPLPTGPDPRVLARGRLLREAMTELAAHHATEPDRLTELPWWQRQEVLVRTRTHGAHRVRLQACLARVAQRSGPRSWSGGSWHGDWSPWNMAYAEGRVSLWDWERFETGVPLGLDAVHHEVSRVVARNGFTVPSLLAGLRPRTDVGEDAGLLALAYLLAIAVRYLSLADALLGAAVRGRGEVVLETLELLLDLGPDR